MNEWKNRFSSLTIQMAGSILRTMKEIPLVSVDDRTYFLRLSSVKISKQPSR